MGKLKEEVEYQTIHTWGSRMPITKCTTVRIITAREEQILEEIIHQGSLHTCLGRTFNNGKGGWPPSPYLTAPLLWATSGGQHSFLQYNSRGILPQFLFLGS